MEMTTGTGIDMKFSERLVILRKQKGLTQKALAAVVKIHFAQIQRYEAGTSQPTLDVIRKLAVALSVTADLLIFDKDERGPDDDLLLQFEAISRFKPAEKKFVKEVLDSLILKHEAKRWSTA
jgi:transcriptional regulator with XRE-family HTH domain